MMEEIDAGTNLVKELKLAGNQAPVLLLSSMGDQLNLSTGYRELGLDAVFQKPVNAEALLRTIKAKLTK
jgi:DNA-binding response OmpR family regulator